MKHKHHIIPKHDNGSDDISNIIELTVEEHAEVHKKLYDDHGRWQDYLAWRGLSGQIGKKDAIREAIVQSNKARKGLYIGCNNPFYGKVHSDHVKENISKANKGNTVWRGRTHKEASKLKIKENHADFTGENNPFYGKKHSDQVKEKIRDYMNLNNPSRGTCWINDGITAKRIPKDQPIPLGWFLGRKLKGV